jgi:orotidine-5'-phosphate decarboxylase
LTTQQLTEQIHKKKSFLCIGLDVDLDKIPQYLLQEDDPFFAFNKAIIDATHHLCVAYKPNIAFYEAYGLKGWQALKKTVQYLNESHPEIFTIADAKRGDIGNTSSRYAKAFFEDLEFDSLTVAPYMGKDSVEPFLTFEGKHTILLALTSNEGALNFQTKTIEGKEFYKQVIETSKTWKNSERLMYVVGNLQDVCKYGMNDNVGLLVNSSRGIIYASNKTDFAQAAAKKASELQQQMKEILN